MSNPELLRRKWLEKVEQIVESQLEALTGGKPTKEETIKIPELIKLIDLHTKLQDHKAGTKEFWDMIEQIRRETLPGGSKSKPRTRRRRRNRKGTASCDASSSD